jgi:hypothetical protein
MRRAVIVSAVGLTVIVVLVWFLPWGLAVVVGWDAAALGLLVSIWPIILRADAAHAAQLARREDETRGTATVLLLGASVASLLGVGLALHLAGEESGSLRVLLIGVAVLTVVVSWTVVNTVYTLRYADLHFSSRDGGIAFGDPDGQEPPTYRDFAYVGHHGARPADPEHRALPRLLVVSVRRGDRGRFGQLHWWPALLTPLGQATALLLTQPNRQRLSDDGWWTETDTNPSRRHWMTSRSASSASPPSA